MAIQAEHDGFSHITQRNQEPGPIHLGHLRHMLPFIKVNQVLPCHMKLIPFDEIACITEPTDAANNPIPWAEPAIGYLRIQRSEGSRERKAQCLFGLMQLCCRGLRILKASGEHIATRIPVENVVVSGRIHEKLVSA